MNAVAAGGLTATGGLAQNVGRGDLASAAKEFESILLSQWLKEAESTFGSVPGNEEDDSGGEQMRDFAMQHVATDVTNRGGIGIAPIVEKALLKQETPQVAPKPEGRR